MFNNLNTDGADLIKIIYENNANITNDLNKYHTEKSITL